MAYERPAWAGTMEAHQGPPPQKMVSVDVHEFIRTRDALTAAYLSLSGALDRAVKAYLDHTAVVLAGDASLNVSHLLQPFQVFTNHAQLAQLALQQNGGPAPSAGGEPEKKKRAKRAYKQRDPNAPKRPLTAYFRYLGEMRPAIQKEMQDHPDQFESAGKPGDISKIATERWNALNKEEQQPYREAYQDALKHYEKAAAEYKAQTGKGDESAVVVDETKVQDGDEDAEGEEDGEAAEQHMGTAGAKNADDDDSTDTSSDDASDSDAVLVSRAPPPPPPPAAARKPKSALKKSKAVEETPPPFQAFNSINPAQLAALAKSTSPERKRKGDSEADGGKKKKKSRKSEPVVAAEDVGSSPPALPARMMSSPDAVAAGDRVSKKKKDKKKRKE